MSSGSDGSRREADSSQANSIAHESGVSHSLEATSEFSDGADSRGSNSGSAGYELKGGSSEGAVPPLPEVLGRFRIKKMLGRGGMGCVYLAHDEQLDRPVALKVPKLTADPDSTLQQRFFREARAAAVLNHPNICPIFDIGQQGDVHFIAMGFIEGRPLTAYIESNKRQPCRQSAVVVRKIALALADAHAKGIIHRDLKPANIMIDRRGEPIVMDFGLASRFDDEQQTRLTRDGMVVGTLAYMSPEQLDNRAVIGPESDIYSLGVVLYELLTGQCAFRGNVGSVVAQILSNEPKPIAEIRDDVPSALAAICRRAMAKNPSDRFASMKDFADALANYLKGATTTSMPAATRASGPSPDLDMLELLTAASSGPAGSVSPGVLLPRKRSRLSGGAIAGIAGGVIGIVAIIAIAVMATTGSSTPAIDQQAAASTAPKASSSSPTESTRVALVPPASKPNAEPAVNLPQQETPPAPVASPPAPMALASSPHVADDVAIDGTVRANPAVTETNTSRPEPTESAKESPKERDEVEVIPLESPPGEPPPLRSELPRGPQPGGPDHPGPPKIDSIDAIKAKFDEMDRNSDGKLDGGEVPMHIIMRADTNHDRKATLTELTAAFRKLGSKLFEPPTEEERRKLPNRQPGGPQGPNDARRRPPR